MWVSTNDALLIQAGQAPTDRRCLELHHLSQVTDTNGLGTIYERQNSVVKVLKWHRGSIGHVSLHCFTPYVSYDHRNGKLDAGDVRLSVSHGEGSAPDSRM
jgi:hypothetical protein